MNQANTVNTDTAKTVDAITKVRHASTGIEPLILTDIYQEDVNIVVWRRQLPSPVNQAVSKLLSTNPGFQATMTVSPERVLSSLGEVLDGSEYAELAENIAELVDMFCCLFELSQTGLRLTTLDKAMCPKFHVDRVPCRLVTTYHGTATEWLPHQLVDRTKLGPGSHGLADSESGLYISSGNIKQLSCGDVALLKGENWYNNENAGLVHRSPTVTDGDYRLLLTLDFAD